MLPACQCQLRLPAAGEAQAGSEETLLTLCVFFLTLSNLTVAPYSPFCHRHSCRVPACSVRFTTHGSAHNKPQAQQLNCGPSSCGCHPAAATDSQQAAAAAAAAACATATAAAAEEAQSEGRAIPTPSDQQALPHPGRWTHLQRPGRSRCHHKAAADGCEWGDHSQGVTWSPPCDQCA